MNKQTAEKELVDFELTEDQQEAFDSIIEWLEESDEKFKTLMGYAGTGKTTLLNEIAKYTIENDIKTLFTATTNKAVKVLRSRVNHSNFSTIHSACNIKPKKKGDKEVFEPVKYNKKDITDFDLVVVDEASMTSRKLLDIIDQEIAFHGIKVLFCGDPAQLQPINEEKSKVFEYEPEMLDTIIRHGDTIANKSKLVRETNEYINIKKVIEEPDISRINIEDIARKFKNFRDNPDYIRMLCWTNRQVKLWNSKLRIADYGYKPDDPYSVGDIVIANEPCEISNEIVMMNSEEGVITNVSEQDEFWKLEIDKFSGDKVSVNKLKEEYEDKISNKLSSLASKAKKASKEANKLNGEEKQEKINERKALWGQFWNIKKFYHDIRHCYAMTTHKSQGSTFNNVILDIKDIDLNKELENRNQLVYVAMTRASDNVYIYH